MLVIEYRRKISIQLGEAMLRTFSILKDYIFIFFISRFNGIVEIL